MKFDEVHGYGSWWTTSNGSLAKQDVVSATRIPMGIPLKSLTLAEILLFALHIPIALHAVMLLLY